MVVTQSVMPYGAQIWADSFGNQKYKNHMISVQIRDAVCVAFTYYSVSHTAIFIVAGTIPTNLLVEERKYTRDRKKNTGKPRIKTTANMRTV